MDVAVVGLWHLGCVTAACLSKAGHRVWAYDPDEKCIQQLQQFQPPIFEPGLQALIQEGCEQGLLKFTQDLSELSKLSVVWVNFDTPVDEQDVAQVSLVIDHIKKLLPVMAPNSLLIISSQLPVGTAHQLEQYCLQHHAEKRIALCYIPENLRLGKAIDVFMQQERIVVGLNNRDYQPIVEKLLSSFTPQLIWMSIASAEMSKHAVNAFLALSVVFINELAVLCESVGANAYDVEKALKSEQRIGSKAYLHPGDAIAGGTLMRDIRYLDHLAQEKGLSAPLIASVFTSNDYHKHWVRRKLLSLLENFNNKRVAVLGLAYKVGTDTLRRSATVEMCEWLHEQGGAVVAFDPHIKALPEPFSSFITMQESLDEALDKADAVVITTPYPQFKELTANQCVAQLSRCLILDPSGVASHLAKSETELEYFCVGMSA